MEVKEIINQSNILIDELNKYINKLKSETNRINKLLTSSTKNLYIITRRIRYDKIILAICTSKDRAYEFKKEYISKMTRREIPSVFTFYWSKFQSYSWYKWTGLTKEEINCKIIERWKKSLNSDEQYDLIQAKQELNYYMGKKDNESNNEDEKKEDDTINSDVYDYNTDGDIYKNSLTSYDTDIEITYHKALDECYPNSSIFFVAYYPMSEYLDHIIHISKFQYKIEPIATGLQLTKNVNGYKEYLTREFLLDELVFTD